MLSATLGLTQFGVNQVTLEPRFASSQRHWHVVEDEFVIILAGEVVLVTDAGETVLHAGMCAGFPAGRADGHRLINRSDSQAVYLEVGTRAADEEVLYSDIDMRARKEDGRFVYTRKSGEPYE
ncbi:Cupin domain protein [Methyloligella halotolerans]|uniref:Cupin domain protein n=1 Tax=Methyloligella halotolerans TaxID=1177755 RepID=A0A1E2S146_9HYPH|nr:Cupin domain protein [Methyloligella halotolerans]